MSRDSPTNQTEVAPPPPQDSDVTDMIPVKKDHRKYLSLVVLIIQNTALVLVMRYSRTVTVNGERYLASTAVVLTELLKLSVCTMMVFQGAEWDISKGLTTLYVEIIQKKGETLKVSVPSVLYTIQNNLLYLALTYLDAATFQVTYQIKILTTALFSVIILGRSLSPLKWVSLVLLTIAVALVQFSKVEEPSLTSAGSLSTALIGLVAVLCASVTSGFAGVYTEKILKGSDTSMWIRNIQLGESKVGLCLLSLGGFFYSGLLVALLSFFIGLFAVAVTDGKAVLEGGFFQGYSPVVAAVICLQALGGLVVAAVMKYADNILKGFAAALSIVLSSIISYFFLSDFYPTWYFVGGAVLVLVSTVMYSQPQAKPPSEILPTRNPPKTV